MDGELNPLACRTETFREFGDGVLGLCHRHPVAGSDDDTLSVLEQLGDVGRSCFSVLPRFTDLCGRRVTEPSEDHGDERAVHGLAHDVGEDRA